MKDVYNQIILISTIAAVQLLFLTLLNDLFTITGMATIIIRIGLHRLVELRLFRNGMRPFCSANPAV